MGISSSSISITILPLGQFGQEPEPSQATGMALVCCILGKFLGVVCHCFPSSLDVPTFIARHLLYGSGMLHPGQVLRGSLPLLSPQVQMFPLSSPGTSRSAMTRDILEKREKLSGNFAYMASLFMPLGTFYMPQSFTSPLKEGVLRIFSPLKWVLCRKIRRVIHPYSYHISML